MSIIRRPRGAGGALRATGLGVIALLVALAAAASSHSPASYADTLVLSGNGTAGAPVTTSAAAPGSFRISGSVAGLYPGAQLPLVLTVTNPEHFAIVVSSLSVTVGAAMPGCGAANLTATSFARSLHVPALGTAAVSVQVTLAHSAPNACQGAVFPLHYTGLAGKAT
jgi:hypothetical protein